MDRGGIDRAGEDRRRKRSVGGGRINSSLLNILSVSCYASEDPSQKRELLPASSTEGT